MATSIGPETHVLKVPARLCEVRRVQAWLERALSGRDLASDEVFAIELCLEEAVTNVAMHAARARDDVTVGIELAFADGCAVVTVTDDGGPFDPLSTSPKPPSASLEDAEPGGRGLQLLRAFASELCYARRGNLNHLTMTARLGQAAG